MLKARSPFRAHAKHRAISPPPPSRHGSSAPFQACAEHVRYSSDRYRIAALRRTVETGHYQTLASHQTELLFGRFVADQQHQWRNVEPSDLGEKESFGSYLICLKAVGKCREYSFYKVQDFYNTTMRSQMRNIMVATDGSDGANRAVNVAAELAKAASATLLIVTVARALSAEEKQFMRIERDMAEPASRLFPKLAQPIDPALGRVSRDDRSVDGSDRYAGDPVRMDVCLSKGLVDASLVCAESAAALQDQRDAFEWELPPGSCEVWSDLKIHRAPH